MNKIKIFFAVTLLITTLIGCSQTGNTLINVTIDGEMKQITGDVFAIISNKNQLTVKSAISPSEKGDIEIVRNNVTYKIFENNGKSAVVYFNDGGITQYEISKDDLDKIKKLIK